MTEDELKQLSYARGRETQASCQLSLDAHHFRRWIALSIWGLASRHQEIPSLNALVHVVHTIK